jgi:hypothetical protein
MLRWCTSAAHSLFRRAVVHRAHQTVVPDLTDLEIAFLVSAVVACQATAGSHPSGSRFLFSVLCLLEQCHEFIFAFRTSSPDVRRSTK